MRPRHWAIALVIAACTFVGLLWLCGWSPEKFQGLGIGQILPALAFIIYILRIESR